MHNIETGKTKSLRGTTLQGLCKALSVHPDFLLGGKHGPSMEAMTGETELVSIWRRLHEDDREHLLAVARALSSRKTARPQRDHAPAKLQEGVPIPTPGVGKHFVP